MNLQSYYTVDLNLKFSPILRKFFILLCPDVMMKFFCDCVQRCKWESQTRQEVATKSGALCTWENESRENLFETASCLEKKTPSVGLREGFAFIEIVSAIRTESFEILPWYQTVACVTSF